MRRLVEKQSTEPEVLIEKIYHLTHCDRHELAASIIDESGRELVGRGHIEMLQLLERIDISDLSEELSCKMLQLKGEVLLLLARFTEIENVYLMRQWNQPKHLQINPSWLIFLQV